MHPKSKGGRANASARKLTVKQAAEIWLDAVRLGRNGREQGAEPSTLRQYRGHVDLHIVPFFVGEKLSDLTATRVTAFSDHLLGKLSRPLARKVLVSFKSILRECQSRDLISANPGSTQSEGSTLGSRVCAAAITVGRS